MKPTRLQSISLIILAVLILGWSELYLPVPDSLKVDVMQLARELYRARQATHRYKAAIPGLERDLKRLAVSVDEQASRFVSAFTEDLYIAVNAAANRLYLRRGRDVIIEAVISTGSEDTLARGERYWIFKTPRGVMTVWRKKEKPVWFKPDWAFLEAGETIPPMDSPLRRERGVLGDYLLDLGGGVAIHGTPQEHLLGRSVTHGCIRVGKEDIKVLYDSVPVGTRVYIY